MADPYINTLMHTFITACIYDVFAYAGEKMRCYVDVGLQSKAVVNRRALTWKAGKQYKYIFK